MQIIRNLREGDVEAVLRIMSDFPDAYGASYRDSEKRGGIRWLFHYALSQNDPLDARCFVLELDGKVVGHLAYLKDVRCFEGGVYELRALAVDKDHQKRDL